MSKISKEADNLAQDTLRQFRILLSGFKERLSNLYIYKVAKDYGIVQDYGFDGKFYFEVGDSGNR